MKKKIYEILRKYVAKKATGNLGRIIIYDDKIVCFVDGRKLKKKEKRIHRYNLIFKCIPLNEEIYTTYNVDKPVHYIIRNVEFDREINIMASTKNCHVTFMNCTFTGAVEIDFADQIQFINNTYNAQNYKNFFSIHKEGEFCISTRANKNEINKIEFLDDKIEINRSDTISTVTKKTTNEPPLQIWLYAKEINIFKTDIVNAKSIDIGTDELFLNDLNITSEEIEISSTKFVNDFTTIQSDVICMETGEYISIDANLNCDSIFINGVDWNKNESNIDTENFELQQHRLELLGTLKKIETHAEEQISQELKKEPLTRVLKR